MKLRDLNHILARIKQEHGEEISVDVGLNHDKDGFYSKPLEFVDAGTFAETVMLHGGDIELAPGVTLSPTQGICDEIQAERHRQQSAEGWTPEHDDAHVDGELARAAGFYAMQAAPGGVPRKLWPWAWNWFKPTTARRDLIKAAALIVAEIERLDRAEPK